LEKQKKHEFYGTAPQIDNIEGDVHSALEEGVQGLLVGTDLAEDIIKALEQFCFKRSAFKESFNKGHFSVVEKNYKYDKEDGEIAVSRLEGENVSNCKLVVHTDYKNAVQDIIKNDIWFDYKFDDGKIKRVSVASAVFNRPAKHYLREVEKDYKGRSKIGGHLTSPDETLANEQEANNISGRYAFINDAIYLWFLASYSFEYTTRYNNQVLAERLRWIYANKEIFDFTNQFPNINESNFEDIIKLVLFVNYHYFNRKDANGDSIKVPESAIDSCEEIATNENVLAYMGGIDESSAIQKISSDSNSFNQETKAHYTPEEIKKKIKDAQKVESFSRNEIIMFGVGLITALSLAGNLVISVILVYFTNWYALLTVGTPVIYFLTNWWIWKHENKKFKAGNKIQEARKNLELWMQDENWAKKVNSLNQINDENLMDIIRIVGNRDLELKMFEIMKVNVKQDGAKEIVIRAGYVSDKNFTLKLLKNAFHHYNRPPPIGLKNELWQQIFAINSEYGFPKCLSFLTIPFAATKFISTFPSRNLELNILELLEIFKQQDNNILDEISKKRSRLEQLKYYMKCFLKSSLVVQVLEVYGLLKKLIKSFRRYSLGYREENVLYRRNPFLFLNKIGERLSEIMGKSVSFNETKKVMTHIMQSAYTLEEIEDKLIFLGVIPQRLKTKIGKKVFLGLCSSIWNIVSHDVSLPESLDVDNDFNFPRDKVRGEGVNVFFYGFVHGVGRYIFLKDEVAKLIKKLKQEDIFFYSEQNMSDTYGYCDKIVRNITGRASFLAVIAGRIEEKKEIFAKKYKCHLDLKMRVLGEEQDKYRLEIVISGKNKVLIKRIIDLFVEEEKKKGLIKREKQEITIKDIVIGEGTEIDDFSVIKNDKESFSNKYLRSIIPVLENIFQYVFYPFFSTVNPSSGLVQGLMAHSIGHQRTINDLKTHYLLTFLGQLPEPINFTSEKYLNAKNPYNDEKTGRSFYMVDFSLQEAKKHGRKNFAWVGGNVHQPLMVWLAQHLEFIQKFQEDEHFYPYRETNEEDFMKTIKNVLDEPEKDENKSKNIVGEGPVPEGNFEDTRGAPSWDNRVDDFKKQETGIVKIISDYILRIARGEGPGVAPSLDKEKQKNIWQAVKDTREDNIAVFLPVEVDERLEKDIKKMKTNMSAYGKKLEIRSYGNGTLRSRLANCKGMKKIIITNAETNTYIRKLIQDKDNGTENIDMFRDVRVLNMKIPKIKDEAKKTVFQSEIVMIAILARLLEQESLHFDVISGLLKDLLADSFVSSKVKVGDFIRELAVTEDDSTDIKTIKNRLQYFLQETPAISLIRRLERELRAIREFWSYA
ncbi:MAG: hypothetical protein KJ864_02485, partial [Candidatus Omnitrophica bacterium]|nr:hypothetical protein [Candidatus Omnitrophota bacterium]